MIMRRLVTVGELRAQISTDSELCANCSEGRHGTGKSGSGARAHTFFQVILKD